MTDVTKEDDPESPADADAKAEAESVAAADAKAEAQSARPEARRAADGAASPAHKPMLRSVYYVLWFFVVPLVLAWTIVWALTPPSGVDREGFFGWVQSWVREQPVPATILAFTAVGLALWAVRYRLPLAFHAYPPLRSDLPKSARSSFERARLLLEEAEAILDKHVDSIARDLSKTHREKLAADLDALEDAMEREPFDEEIFLDAFVKAEGEVDVRLSRWRKSEMREYAESIVVAVLVALGLRVTVIEAFKIPSGSMIPTLQIGDHIFVNKFIYGPAIPLSQSRLWTNMPPHRGDVVVFANPQKPEEDYIKRVIAIPGDKLEAESGHPVINGWRVPSCHAGTYRFTEAEPGEIQAYEHDGELFVEFLEDEAYLTLYDNASMDSGHEGPFFVKPGEIWAMGDNRNNSSDSRKWWGGRGGGVPFANIRGRALVVWLTLGGTFDASRIFAPVMGRPPAHGPFGHLPASMQRLEPEIERCLRERPPLDQTRPPPGEGTIR